MSKYEAMLVIKSDLSGDERKVLFGQINDTLTKNNGTVLSANIWAEKRRLSYPIKKYPEAMFYLMNFTATGETVSKIRYAYRLNENILRVLITKIE